MIPAGVLVSLAGVLYLNQHAPLRQNTPAAGGQPRATGAPAPSSDPGWRVTATHGAWETQCPVAGKNPCVAVLRLIQQPTNTTVFGWIVGKGGNGAWGMTVESPTGVVIDRGLELKVGDGPPRQLVYSTCTPQRCTSSAPIDAALMRDLQTANRASAKIYASSGQTLEFGIPLTGFKEAVASLGQ
jgi:invasion protein IalB